MNLLLFSDIHGNADALEAMLAREGADRDTVFVFCGDVAGYYYEQARCIRLLRGIPGLLAVLGNHDRYALDAFGDEALTAELVRRYGSSYFEKNEEVRAYLEGLPERRDFELAGKRITVCHGSPEDALEGRLYPDSELPDAGGADIVVCGHTHYAMVREADGCVWLNPGSLGQPRDGRGFGYLVYDPERGTAEFREVEIDRERLARQARERDPEREYLWKVLERIGRR